MFAICNLFSYLENDCGTNLLRNGERRQLLLQSLTTDPVLVLTVNLQYWHTGSPTGENLTLNIPAVGLLGPPTLQITLW